MGVGEGGGDSRLDFATSLNLDQGHSAVLRDQQRSAATAVVHPFLSFLYLTSRDCRERAHQIRGDACVWGSRSCDPFQMQSLVLRHVYPNVSDHDKIPAYHWQSLLAIVARLTSSSSWIRCLRKGGMCFGYMGGHTEGVETRASSMLSECGTTEPCAPTNSVMVGWLRVACDIIVRRYPVAWLSPNMTG